VIETGNAAKLEKRGFRPGTREGEMPFYGRGVSRQRHICCGHGPPLQAWQGGLRFEKGRESLPSLSGLARPRGKRRFREGRKLFSRP